MLVAIDKVNGNATHVAPDMLQAAFKGRGMTDGFRCTKLGSDDGEKAVVTIGLWR